MIRWYDYVAAVMVADFIAITAYAGVTSDNMWVSLFTGAVIALMYDVWTVYCAVRKINERKGR